MWYFILPILFITSAFCHGENGGPRPLTVEDCKRLHLYDEGGEYKPGVDVHGRPVVSADINGGYQFPDLYSVPVGFMAGRTDSNSTSTTIKNETNVTTYTPNTSTTTTSSFSNTNSSLVSQSPPGNFIFGSNVGIVSLHSDGSMYMDGVPMHDEMQNKLRKACKELRKRQTTNTQSPKY